TELFIPYDIEASRYALAQHTALSSIQLLNSYTPSDWEGSRSDNPQAILNLCLRSSVMVRISL
ncbi:hypothetical protein NL491_27295, partial [Klebsiella pneumoniae]|nr:hypothetical protein [Klebsiella pneumoniae]